MAHFLQVPLVLEIKSFILLVGYKTCMCLCTYINSNLITLCFKFLFSCNLVLVDQFIFNISVSKLPTIFCKIVFIIVSFYLTNIKTMLLAAQKFMIIMYSWWIDTYIMQCPIFTFINAYILIFLILLSLYHLLCICVCVCLCVSLPGVSCFILCFQIFRIVLSHVS